jgi:hypothetical protein
MLVSPGTFVRRADAFFLPFSFFVLRGRRQPDVGSLLPAVLLTV